MTWQQTKKVLFITIWISVLAWPLMGWYQTVRLAGSILIGGFVWIVLAKIFKSSGLESAIRRAGSLIRESPLPSRRFRIGAVFALVLIGPLFLNNYSLDILTLAGIYVVLALGLNIVVGMAGLLDLGYVSFYAIGAYSYALLSTKLGISFWIALPIGGFVAALFGVLLGVITLRLRGDYLAIVTLGFILIVNQILKNWDSVTNGPNGILGIGRPAIGSFVFSQPIHFYYLILGIVLITIFAVQRLSRSRIGRAWVAIREDEIAAETMGVNTMRLKVLAFSMGATWAGIAGVFFAGKFAFVSPESFTFFESVVVLSMVVLGGLGSIPGVILGALMIEILPEILRGFQDYRMLFFGAAMVGMMLFRPQGLLGSARNESA
jgi:branched-chain amino acid transport system permease protein